jgi:hydroxyacylglutathione hydrolase
MYFAQYYLDCLSQASYLIGDETTGRAVVVDPRRDVSGYLDDARARGLTIEAVINTHFHADFAAGHLRGSLNVPADGRFAERAGMVIDPGTEIVVVAPPGGEQEVITRLGRIGFDTVAGYLKEPEAAFLTVPGEVDQASRLTASQLRAVLDGPRPPAVLDVRNATELADGGVGGARHIPLAELPMRLAEVPDTGPIVVYCAHGSRSSIAASLLRRSGRADVSDLIGGAAAWRLSLTPAQM